jgi:predicted esterase
MQATGFNFNSLIRINVILGAISLMAFGCGDGTVTELTPDSDFNTVGTDAVLATPVPAAEHDLPNRSEDSGRAVAVNSDSKPLYPQTESPERLNVPGFNDAMFVSPSERSDDPRPVVIVLHGNFDRPEWQCDMWQSVASWYGWVLCPRGVRTPWATEAEDRWTYRGGAKTVSSEMMAALAALEFRFPGAVTREGAVLVGFSLGAILIPELIQLHPDRFDTVFLIEGGLKQLDRHLLSMKQRGVERIGLAMSTAGNRQKISGIRMKIKRKGLVSVYVDMRGAGHNYRQDFSSTGQKALRYLLGDTNDLTVSNR